MKEYGVTFLPEARQQLTSLYHYIATKSAPETAKRYTEAIVAHCEELRAFPYRGMARDDIRPGLRLTNYKHRTVIAYAVDENAPQVLVIGIYYGGQDFTGAPGDLL